MFQAESLHLPTWVPPEMFNNINTFTVLIFLAVCERTSRRSQSLGISAHTRVAAGFVLMSFTMVWCGVVQTVVTGRGFYNDNEEYVLKEGKEKLSSAVLIVPYVVQGIAAGLVDPSVMEIAYVGAPAQMKGTVMGLYWLASSCSGFLGVVFSPIMHPSNATWLFFTFGLCQLCVTGVFYYFNASKTRSIGG
ncbi:POT family, putative [Angomonas deanei]|uniref:POT family, putative n=1 Tax=Angomonas deanei TaxID=59799 RepID=A0A7G2CD92_9TRYP|nr:POT family, putative [Angomonas deanei]